MRHVWFAKYNCTLKNLLFHVHEEKTWELYNFTFGNDTAYVFNISRAKEWSSEKDTDLSVEFLWKILRLRTREGMDSSVRLFPLALISTSNRHQYSARNTTVGEYSCSLRAPVRIRRCLVNRTKWGERRIRSRVALIAWAETRAGFPRGLDRHRQINDRQSDYSADNDLSI